MQKSEVKDLTVGSPMKLILSFAVPMLLGFLFQQFYNMVDTIIVGKCLGVSGGGWIDGVDQLYDHRFLYRCLQRICDSGGAEVRRGRLQGNEKVRGECRMAFSGVRGGHDDGRRCTLHEYFTVDEFAGGYYSGRI